MQEPMKVEQWIAMFREVGLGDTKMKQWHSLFEKRHPQAHQNFLEWLGLPPEKISQIRSEGR